ncbi:MAG: hypothetical protein ACI8PZ_002306 [Myxococcota bacterium]
MSDTFAVCGKCGERKADYDRVCPHCGFRPEGEGMLVAWLLSTHHRAPDTLDAVGARIAAGEAVRPSKKMLATARRALGRSWTSDPGMSSRERLSLLATSLVVTPLVGWVLAVWWYEQRPRAALQALALSLPASVLFFGLGLYLAAAG